MSWVYKYFTESRNFSNSLPVTLWHWSTNQGEPHESPLHIAFSAFILPDFIARRIFSFPLTGHLTWRLNTLPRWGWTQRTNRKERARKIFLLLRVALSAFTPPEVTWPGVSFVARRILSTDTAFGLNQPGNLSASECHPKWDYDEWWYNHRCFENIMNIMKRRNSQSLSILLFRKALACNPTHSKSEENSIRNHQVIDI